MDQARFAGVGQSGPMSRNALILITWYTWLALLVGAALYVLIA
jgi:hypothetical protein